MAMPMSAQQVMELQRKKNPVPKNAAMPEQGKTMQARPPVAAPRPSTGGVVPSMPPKPLTPMAASPQAAQMKPKAAIPNMPMAAAPKNLIGTPGQAAKPTNLIGTPKQSMPTPMVAGQVTAELQRKKNLGIPPTNTANQTQYNSLTSNNQITPQAAGGLGGNALKTANGGYVPPSDITTPQDGTDLWGEAGNLNAIERAGLANTVDMQANSIKGNAEWVNQLIGDQRVLENQSFLRNNDPVGWDGSAGYRATQLSRGREIDDTLRGGELLNQLNANQAELANFDKLAPERQRQIYAGLLEKERAYGLDLGNQAINEGQLTGEYFNPKAQNIANQIIGLKQQAEAPGITADQRAALSAQANGLRSQLTNMGADASQFGANVNSSAAQGNMSGLGQKTLGQQTQDYNQTADTRDFNEDVRRVDREFTYTQGRDKVADQQWESEFNRIKDQDGIQNAIAWASHNLNVRQENRVAANQSGGGGGGRSSGGSSGSSGYKPSTEKTIQDINLPRSSSSMETYIINNLPGGKNVFGPPSPNQLGQIESMILGNPNLSEADMVKLYKKFGIPLPE